MLRIVCQNLPEALDRPGGTREIMECTGQKTRLVSSLTELSQDARLFERGEPADLSQFDLRTAVQRYETVLASV